MDEDILKLRVGVFVLFAMLILATLISLNSEGWISQYTVYVEPINAPGVTIGTPIRKNGILIGRVKEVTSKDDHVLLRLGINQSEAIYENEVCSIGTQSLLGDSVVEFITLPRERRGDALKDNSIVAQYELKQSLMDTAQSMNELAPKIHEALGVVQIASESIGEAGVKIGELAQTVQSTLQDPDSEFKELIVDLRIMSQKGQAAMDNFDRMFENLNDVLGDPEMKSQLKQMVGELPKIFQETRGTIADIGETIREFKSIPDNVNENLENFKPFTESLGQRGPEILAQVHSAVDNIDRFVAEASELTEMIRKFKDSDGSLKRFLTDDKLYRDFVEITENVKEASVNIKKVTAKAIPLMNDVRVAGDKIARNPGVLLRGAVNKRTNYKGSPGRNQGSYQYE